MLQVIHCKVLLQGVYVVQETNYNKPIIYDCWSGCQQLLNGRGINEDQINSTRYVTADLSR